MDSKTQPKPLDELKTEMDKPLYKLSHCLAPLEVREHKRFYKEGEPEYALQWVGLLGADKKPANEVAAQLNLLQLGLLLDTGKINEKRAVLISDYIWKQHPSPSNYTELVYWLKQNHPREELPALHSSSKRDAESKPIEKPARSTKNKQLKKKRKQQRKARKSSRKK